MSIRTVSADGSEASEWMPVGGLAVPRSNSVDTAVSMAIFNNEDELLKGAFRAFPKLKTSKDKFEYGYRLRDFPEDEVRVRARARTRARARARARLPAARVPRGRGEDDRGSRSPLLPPRTRTALATRFARLTPASHPPHTRLTPSQIKVATKDASKESTNPFMHAASGDEAAAVCVAPLLPQHPGGCARCIQGPGRSRARRESSRCCPEAWSPRLPPGGPTGL